MPKIIENVREQLLAVAKQQIAKQGYAKTTIRSVASECGLGVGTVYNYFKSKDMLIATFMLEDWQECLERMKSSYSDDTEAVLRGIYDALQDFMVKHNALFADSDAAKVFATVFSQKHKLLRCQMADIILPLLSDSKAENKLFLAEFIAESLLTWTVEGRGFNDLFPIISLLLK